MTLTTYESTAHDLGIGRDHRRGPALPPVAAAAAAVEPPQSLGDVPRPAAATHTVRETASAGLALGPGAAGGAPALVLDAGGLPPLKEGGR
ncbi:hypothetical protein HYH03_003204 [Edaphochlamys debaryana]|uniref:Uncharacterized protein n=1 Tax=Edaphochlamys debaryana TaxID=47281 RepID=A0A836C4L2_9CHLO|nr:hypothetical protein HYH03_003204 [Edaphochlamys debaryana]|eukprot:KAG2499018.1 hypothetical protein HYH03_003204 [Edaphochlamys debaryana]